MVAAFELSADNGHWEREALGLPAQRANGLRVRVVLAAGHEGTHVRLVLPVHDPSSPWEGAAEAHDTLMSRAAWEGVHWSGVSGPAGVERDPDMPGVLVLLAPDVPEAPAGQVEWLLSLNWVEGAAFRPMAARAECLLELKPQVLEDEANQSWLRKGKVVVELFVPESRPVIRHFRAEQPLLRAGQKGPLLRWAVESLPVGEGVRILDADGRQLAPVGDAVLPPSGEHLVEAGEAWGVTTYTLLAGAHARRTIHVQRYTQSAFHTWDAFPEGHLPTGLHTHGGVLYALAVDVAAENVFLWQLTGGLRWQRVTHGGHYISFRQTLGREPVPLKHAESPAVVCNDCLYLVGGSRVDSDFKSGAMYMFDFTRPADGFRLVAVEGTALPRRMGHAVLTHNGRVYVLGGSSNTGSLQDVWSYDPVQLRWRQEATMRMPVARTMHSCLVVKDSIVVFGGFSKNPGTSPVRGSEALYRFDLKQGAWRPVDLGDAAAVISYSAAFAVPGRDGVPVLFTAHASKEGHPGVLTAWNLDEGQATGGAWLSLMRSSADGRGHSVFDLFNRVPDRSAVQVVVWAGVAWINQIAFRDELEASPLRYFVYAGN